MSLQEVHEKAVAIDRAQCLGGVWGHASPGKF